MPKKNKKNYTERIGKLTKPIFWTFCLLLVMGGVLATVEMAGTGAELTNLKRDEIAAAKVNDQLNQDLAEYSSLSVLSSQASASGFMKPEATLYISGSSVVAARLP